MFHDNRNRACSYTTIILFFTNEEQSSQLESGNHLLSRIALGDAVASSLTSTGIVCGRPDATYCKTFGNVYHRVKIVIVGQCVVVERV